MARRKAGDGYRMVGIPRPPPAQLFMEQIRSLKNICYLGLTPEQTPELDS
jgi:hypothetical protein